MVILVCFALKEEAAPFRQIASGKTDVAIRIVGIGRENAEKSMRDFFAGGTGDSPVHSPDSLSGRGRLARTPVSPGLVLTCGFAGGLSPDLKLGDVIFEFPAAGSRGDGVQIKEKLEPPYDGYHEKLIAAGAKPAKFFCADRIATTVAEKKLLREQTLADAVEMESAAIHAVCRGHGIPCATVRVISDEAGEDLPLDFNALSKPDKSLDFGKLAWAIARSPGKISALTALQKKTSFAARQLARVLEKLV